VTNIRNSQIIYTMVVNQLW